MKLFYVFLEQSLEHCARHRANGKHMPRSCQAATCEEVTNITETDKHPVHMNCSLGNKRGLLWPDFWETNIDVLDLPSTWQNHFQN